MDDRFAGARKDIPWAGYEGECLGSNTYCKWWQSKKRIQHNPQNNSLLNGAD